MHLKDLLPKSPQKKRLEERTREHHELNDLWSDASAALEAGGLACGVTIVSGDFMGSGRLQLSVPEPANQDFWDRIYTPPTMRLDNDHDISFSAQFVNVHGLRTFSALLKASDALDTEAIAIRNSLIPSTAEPEAIDMSSTQGKEVWVNYPTMESLWSGVAAQIHLAAQAPDRLYAAQASELASLKSTD